MKLEPVETDRQYAYLFQDDAHAVSVYGAICDDGNTSDEEEYGVSRAHSATRPTVTLTATKADFRLTETRSHNESYKLIQ